MDLLQGPARGPHVEGHPGGGHERGARAETPPAPARGRHLAKAVRATTAREAGRTNGGAKDFPGAARRRRPERRRLSLSAPSGSVPLIGRVAVRTILARQV